MTPPTTGTALRMTPGDLQDMLMEIVYEEAVGRSVPRAPLTKLEARAIFDRIRTVFARLGCFELGSYDG